MKKRIPLDVQTMIGDADSGTGYEHGTKHYMRRPQPYPPKPADEKAALAPAIQPKPFSRKRVVGSRNG